LYIQRWSIIKNSTKDVPDERAIDAFTVGLRRSDFIKEMGRIRPKTVSELMDIANKFADGEGAYHIKRTRSPKEDRSHRYSNKRHRCRNYDNYSSHSQVFIGYRENNNQGEERQNRGCRNDKRDDLGNNRQFMPRTLRDYNQSPEDMLNRPCHMYYTYVDWKRVSNNMMKDY
jgi:hypothetical protein